MSSSSFVAVWSPWRLHADALVDVLTGQGIPAGVVEEPLTTTGLVVAEAVRSGDLSLLEARHGAGLPTVVWGGTLPAPAVAALRSAGATAYVTLLQSPRELVAVVREVLDGREIPWAVGAGPVGALTSRERQVAQAYLVVWADRTRADVAMRLGMSERTLKVHVANIRAKAGHRGTATRDGLRRTLTVRGWID